MQRRFLEKKKKNLKFLGQKIFQIILGGKKKSVNVCVWIFSNLTGVLCCGEVEQRFSLTFLFWKWRILIFPVDECFMWKRNGSYWHLALPTQLLGRLEQLPLDSLGSVQNVLPCQLIGCPAPSPSHFSFHEALPFKPQPTGPGRVDVCLWIGVGLETGGHKLSAFVYLLLFTINKNINSHWQTVSVLCKISMDKLKMLELRKIIIRNHLWPLKRTQVNLV